MSERIQSGLKALVRLVYPVRAVCMGCGTKAGFERDWLCEDCRQEMASRWVGVAPPPEGVRLIKVPAIELAEKFGVPKAANTMMLAALRAFKATGLDDAHLETALCASFKKKPQLVDKNRDLLKRAEATFR